MSPPSDDHDATMMTAAIMAVFMDIVMDVAKPAARINV
jgi:hypothetical protein